MELTQLKFDVLVYIENRQNKKVTHEELRRQCYVSVGTINGVIGELKKEELIYEIRRSVYQVSEAGYRILEPYRIKRAVLLAAGFGSRMIPITLNTPKPLVRVHNKRIIETALDALLEKGIEEIHVVKGYLGEQFMELKEKYPMIQLYTNKDYNSANSISSALLVRELLCNVYVVEGDLFINNPDVIRKYEFSSNYLGIYKERTDDWRFVMKNNLITGMKMGGGTDCYQVVGISYWTQEDGRHLAEDLVDLYRQPGGKENYWDNVPLGKYNKSYRIRVRRCSAADVVELDTFEELKREDPVYAQ